jgi:hypothetical protein
MEDRTIYGQRLAGPETEGPSPVQRCPSTPGPSVVSTKGQLTRTRLASSGDGRLSLIQGTRKQAAFQPTPDGQPWPTQWQWHAQSGTQWRRQRPLGTAIRTDQWPAEAFIRTDQWPAEAFIRALQRAAVRLLWPAASFQPGIHTARERKRSQAFRLAQEL